MRVNVDVDLEDILRDYDETNDLFLALATFFLNRYHPSSRAVFVLMLLKDIKEENAASYNDLLDEIKGL